MLSAMRELSVLNSCWWMSLPAVTLVPFFFLYQLFAQRMHDKAAKSN